MVSFCEWILNLRAPVTRAVLRNISRNFCPKQIVTWEPEIVTIFPDDADGAVLADLASRGVDMTKRLNIEFPVIVPDKTSAKHTATAMAKAGYKSQIEYDAGELDFDPETDDAGEFGPSWTVYTYVQIVPQYNEVMRVQAELDEIARPLGGKSDGWGVMLGGNAEE